MTWRKIRWPCGHSIWPRQPCSIGINPWDNSEEGRSLVEKSTPFLNCASLQEQFCLDEHRNTFAQPFLSWDDQLSYSRIGTTSPNRWSWHFNRTLHSSVRIILHPKENIMFIQCRINSKLHSSEKLSFLCNAGLMLNHHHIIISENSILHCRHTVV